MDWSLLKPRAKYFLLRNEISFPQPVYYIFMVVDVVGRSAWVSYAIPGKRRYCCARFWWRLAKCYAGVLEQSSCGERTNR